MGNVSLEKCSLDNSKLIMEMYLLRNVLLIVRS